MLRGLASRACSSPGGSGSCSLAIQFQKEMALQLLAIKAAFGHVAIAFKVQECKTKMQKDVKGKRHGFSKNMKLK